MPDFFTVTVSQVTRRLSMLVKGDKALSDIYVAGEISNFTLHRASGHMYFTLKDETSSIKCVMFAGKAAGLTFMPYSGQSVIVRGGVNVYERDGANQIYVSEIIEKGQGELALAFEKAKRELEAGGYFDKKRPIPKQPKKVCLITAEKGAALQDMLNIIARRRPILEVVLIPVTVQGAYAPATLINGIAAAQTTDADLIIIGRGGGSEEDLSCFNDIGYAKALYNSEIPTISAVGHETDFTISDFVADLRAPTPSAAAEIATSVTCDDLSEHIELTYDKLSDIVHSQIEGYEQLIDGYQRHIAAYSPINRLERSQRELELLDSRVKVAVTGHIRSNEALVESYTDKIEALSPVNVLRRGYSAVTVNGRTAGSINDISVGDKAEILMSDGIAKATITEIEKSSEVRFK
ncbi:MAG: exodeoxyribonuclease VII large subunit [Ruminiclostridium sp.]|nr:exodeoxyribonuclease VII large subunit [Ruminiclostridium sp.]